MLKWCFVLIVTSEPPAGFRYLCIDAGSTNALQESLYLGLIRFFGAFYDHRELIVGRPQIEMMLADKRRQLAEITKSHYHSYGREQNGQLECNRYPRGQIEMRLTAYVDRPIAVENPADAAQSRGRTRNTVNKAGGMQAGLP